ncbi:hypothetical protein HYH03_019127, partial [Edaphochlamys debaryana]
QDLLDQYKKAEASQLAVQAEHRRQRDEYHRLAAELRSQHEACPLSSAAKDAARGLGAVSSGLGLATASDGAMLAAWVARDAESLQARREEDKRRRAAKELRAAAAAACRAADDMAGSLAAAREAQAEVERGLATREADGKTMLARAEEYVKRLGQLDLKLKASGFRPEYGHEALTALAADVDGLAAQLSDLTAELHRYEGIPPSAAGMKALLEQAQAEHERLNKAIGRAFARP